MARSVMAVAALSTSMAIGWGASAAATADRVFTVSITGDDGAEVRGECVLERADGVESVRLDGTVPMDRRMTGRALRCMLGSDGRIVVDASTDGSRTKAATTGGQVTIDLK
jgi:hypothetical protein